MALTIRQLRQEMHDNTATHAGGKLIIIGSVRHVTDTQHSPTRFLGNGGLTRWLLSIRDSWKRLGHLHAHLA